MRINHQVERVRIKDDVLHIYNYRTIHSKRKIQIPSEFQERLVMSCEKEIQRVFTHCSRLSAGTNEYPLSFVRIDRDREVYNPLQVPKLDLVVGTGQENHSPKQVHLWSEEVHLRFEKTKQETLKRQRMESQALFASQKMEWESKMKTLRLRSCRNLPAQVDACCVPLVQTPEDFSLLPT